MIVISTFIIPLLSLSLYLGCLEGWEQQMTTKLFLDQRSWHYSKRNKKRNPRPAPEEIAVSPDVGWTWTRSWLSARRSSQKCGRSWCPTRGTIWRYTLAAWQWRWAFQPGIPGKHLKIDGIYGCEWHQKNATFPFLTHFHFYDLRPSLVFAKTGPREFLLHPAAQQHDVKATLQPIVLRMVATFSFDDGEEK